MHGWGQLLRRLPWLTGGVTSPPCLPAVCGTLSCTLSAEHTTLFRLPQSHITKIFNICPPISLTSPASLPPARSHASDMGRVLVLALLLFAGLAAARCPEGMSPISDDDMDSAMEIGINRCEGQ